MNIDPSECRTCAALANDLAAANLRIADLEEAVNSPKKRSDLLAIENVYLRARIKRAKSLAAEWEDGGIFGQSYGRRVRMALDGDAVHRCDQCLSMAPDCAETCPQASSEDAVAAAETTAPGRVDVSRAPRSARCVGDEGGAA